MSQQPFSRPGAVDLSALKRPAAGAPGAPAAGRPGGAAPGSAAGGTGGGAAGSYAVQVDEQSFQSVLEASMDALVLLVFYSPSKMPASADLAEDLTTLSEEFEGRFLLGRVDIDASPQIAQAVQVPQVPYVVAVVQGRPMPLFQETAPIEDLRAVLTQVSQQLATQGVTGRHQPLSQAAPVEAEEPAVDPRYAPAQDALAAGDIDAAVAEYAKLVEANPADAEAAGGLAMAKVLQRTQDADLAKARQAAAENPDDVDAQTLVADLDLAGGHVEDAFARLLDLVRRTVGEDRDRARTHLLGLFDAVGNDDARVLKGRRDLASALF